MIIVSRWGGGEGGREWSCSGRAASFTGGDSRATAYPVFARFADRRRPPHRFDRRRGTTRGSGGRKRGRGIGRASEAPGASVVRSRQNAGARESLVIVVSYHVLRCRRSRPIAPLRSRAVDACAEGGSRIPQSSQCRIGNREIRMNRIIWFSVARRDRRSSAPAVSNLSLAAFLHWPLILPYSSPFLSPPLISPRCSLSTFRFSSFY